MAVRVAVVGGGPLGLMALKNFKDDGFDVTMFESRGWVGGLWKYSEDDSLSTAENTVFNSSKYRTAISDFPVPDDMDDFPSARQLHRYLESYCDHFKLRPHIKLNSPVKLVKRLDERWAFEIGQPDGSTSHTEYFEKVAFSCGHFVKPKMPDFDGIQQFKGTALHAMNFNNPSQFKDKNVLVVGIHASAQDVVSSLSKHAAKTYLSHRSGLLMLPRYTPDGSVYDRMPPLAFTIVTLYLAKFLPTLLNWIMDTLVQSMSKKAFPNIPASWAFSPAPSIAVTPPLIASELYPHLESGFCEPVPDVLRITGPQTVELKDGRILEDVDAIIYCTAYHSSIPVKIEPEDLQPYPYAGSIPQLYRHIFSLNSDPAIRESIAFLGQGAVAFPGFAPHEAQGLCVSQIWLGKSLLPPLSEMRQWHHDCLTWRANMTKQYDAKSTFYTVFVPMTDHLIWMDTCAGLGIRRHFGIVSRWTNKQAWSLWWNDRKLYNACLYGVTSPAIFRLFDEKKRKAWFAAREQIFVDNERVERQQKARQRLLDESQKTK